MPTPASAPAARPEHFFVGSDGDLYRTDRPGWSLSAPVRRNYRRTAREVATAADLKATLRAGGSAWPGGYPLYFLTSDGAALSFESVRKNLRKVLDAIKHGDNSGGWRVVGCDVNWEDGTLTCEHSGKRIASAYAD